MQFSPALRRAGPWPAGAPATPQGPRPAFGALCELPCRCLVHLRGLLASARPARQSLRFVARRSQSRRGSG